MNFLCCAEVYCIRFYRGYNKICSL